MFPNIQKEMDKENHPLSPSSYNPDSCYNIL